MPPPDASPEHLGSNTAAGADGSSAALTEPTSPAAPLAVQPSAAAATLSERGPGMLVKAAAERSKRPQQMQQQPAQQRPQRYVKRMRSQQLLGSIACQEVSNVGLGASARARARSASPVRDSYPVNVDRDQQLQTGRPQSRGPQRCFSANAHPASTGSFSNSCSQMAPRQEDACGSGAPTDVYSSLAPAADMQDQQRQRQDGSVAAGGCASEWVDEFMLDAVHQQLQEVADGWLFSDLGLPDSPTLGDLLRSCAPEDADKPQEHQLPDSISAQQPQQIPLPAQHGTTQLPALDSPILADLLMTGPPAEAPELSWMQLPGSAVLTAQHERAQPATATGAEAHAAAQHAGAEAGVYGADAVFTPVCSQAAAAPMQAGGAGYLLAPMLSDEALAQSLQQVLAAGTRASPSSGHSSGSMLHLDGSLPIHSPQGQHMAQVQGRGLQQQQQMQCGQWSSAPAVAPAADASLQGAGSQAVAACAGRGAAGMVQGAGLAPAAAAEDRPPVGVQGHQTAALASPGPAYAGATPFMAAGSSHSSSCSNIQALLPAAAAAAAGDDELEDMLMSVLTRAGQQAARPPPSRRPMQRHASTGDLLLVGRRDADRLRQHQQFYQPLSQELQPLAGAPPAGERLQGRLSAPDYGFKPALSEGCLVTNLAGRPPGVHSMAGSVSAGSPWALTGPGYPQTAGAAHGSISSSSASSMDGGYREQRQAHGQGIYSLRRVSAPAAAARPGTPASPFQSMQAAAGPAGVALQDAPDAPVSQETATLLHFVAYLLRSSDSSIADIVRQQIVPTVTAAAAQGVEVRPVLKRLWLTLVDANLQAQRAHLSAVLQVAPGASQDSLASKTQDLAAAMSLVMQLRDLVAGTAAAAAPSQLARFNSTGTVPEASTQTVAAMGGLRMMGSSGGMGFDGFEGVSGRAAAGLSTSVPGGQHWVAHRQQSSVRGAAPPDGLDWFDDRVVRAVMRQ